MREIQTVKTQNTKYTYIFNYTLFTSLHQPHLANSFNNANRSFVSGAATPLRCILAQKEIMLQSTFDTSVRFGPQSVTSMPRGVPPLHLHLSKQL